MRKIFYMSPFLALSVSCTTLDKSFKLGAVTGALTGAAAVYGGASNGGRPPTIEEVGLGASIGLGLGLITSYFVHQQVIEDREEMSRQTEIYFGDLPPSPFLIPQPSNRKGGR
ncbi:MAG: hypothetical protein AB7O96_08220 [Pseudobdellovibrionaceae bacterium]